ncbi:unnamed protein product [Closterium sp. NIES-53]
MAIIDAPQKSAFCAVFRRQWLLSHTDDAGSPPPIGPPAATVAEPFEASQKSFIVLCCSFRPWLLSHCALSADDKGSPPPEGPPAATVAEPDLKLGAGSDSKPDTKPAAEPAAGPASASNSSVCKPTVYPLPQETPPDCPCGRKAHAISLAVMF